MATEEKQSQLNLREASSSQNRDHTIYTLHNFACRALCAVQRAYACACTQNVTPGVHKPREAGRGVYIRGAYELLVTPVASFPGMHYILWRDYT